MHCGEATANVITYSLASSLEMRLSRVSWSLWHLSDSRARILSSNQYMGVMNGNLRLIMT